MKRNALLAVALLATGKALALIEGDPVVLTQTNGETVIGLYRRTAPDGVVLTTSNGFTKVPIHQVPRTQWEKFGLSQTTWDEWRAGQAQKAAATSARVSAPAKPAPVAVTSPAATNQPQTIRVAQLQFEARQIGVTRRTQTTWATSYGSFDKVRTHARTVEVTISHKSAGPIDATLEAFWLGSGDRIIDVGGKELTIAPGHVGVRVEVDSGEFNTQQTRYVALGVEIRDSADEIRSWMMRLRNKADGKVLAAVSNPSGIPSDDKSYPPIRLKKKDDDESP